MPQKTKLLSMALLLGFVAAVLSYVYLSKKEAADHQEIRAVIADRLIPSGTVIDASMLRMDTMRRSTLPPQTFISPEAVIGKVSVLEIKQGQPIALSDISQKYKLAQIVDPMMRAVTVAIDPVSGVAGFLKAGDHVDVLATFNMNGGSITKTVLQDVKLIAIGSEVVGEPTEPAAEAGRPAKATPQTNATLLVNPIDTQKLVLADSKGRIRLVLRRSDDSSYISFKGITSRGMIGVVPPDSPQRNTGTVADSQTPAARRSTSAPVQVASAVSPRVFSPAMPPMNLTPLLAPASRTSRNPETTSSIQIVRGTKIEDTPIPE